MNYNQSHFSLISIEKQVKEDIFTNEIEKKSMGTICQARLD